MLLSEFISILKQNSNGVNIIEESIGWSGNQIIPFIKKFTSGTWNSEKRIWDFPNDISNLEKDVELLRVFGYVQPIAPKSNQNWEHTNISVSPHDISQWLSFLAPYNNGIRPQIIEKISLYILKVLNHPLDAFLVTKEMTSSLSMNVNKLSFYWGCIQSIAFCIALKNKVVIPMEISDKAFKSISPALWKDKNGNKSFEDRLTPFAKLLMNQIDFNKTLFQKDFEYYSKNERLILKKSNNLLYYLVSILLDVGISNWEHINFINFPLTKWYQLRIILSKDSQKNANLGVLSFLFTTRTGIAYNFLAFSEIDLQDELEILLKNYKLYLIQRNLPLTNFNTVHILFNKQIRNIRLVKDLTVENIKIWITNFITYSKEENLTKTTTLTRLRSFCKILTDIKGIFERENKLGIYYPFPFSNYDINSPNTRTKLDTDSLYEYGLELINNNIENHFKGTLKAEITSVDSIVRAINNYKITINKEENLIEWFNEYQLLVMLRVLVESGVRVSEAINAPFACLGYVPEEEIDILFLSYNKLHERFGVVPISNVTAEMIKICIDIRKNHFPFSIKNMTLYDATNNKMDEAAPLQFVYIQPINQKVSRVTERRLVEFLDKVCLEAEIERKKGDRFHQFRHRAAEYFFFCMSYYDDFEYKDDAVYKEEVVKKLLRHIDNEMTKEYYWGNLLDLISQKKLVFLKSLPDLSRYDSTDAKLHMDSIIKRVNDDLTNVFTETSITKIIKLLTSPIGLLKDSTLEVLSKNQSFKVIQDHLKKVDGNKSAAPPDAAYFGMCTNYTCPELRKKHTCVSCENHILEGKHAYHLIATIGRCYETLQNIYKDRNEERSQYDHIQSLRARIAHSQFRLYNELGYNPNEMVHLLSRYYQGNLEVDNFQ